MYILTGRSSTIPARAVYLIATFLLVGILHSSIISATPISKRQELDVTEQPDDPVEGLYQVLEDKYPDLEECRNKCNIGADKSVFYSKVGKHEEKPQDFANQNGLKLVRDAYPDKFTDKNPEWTKYTAFAQRFSQAYAEKTSGTAYILLPTDSKTALGNVWVNFERPFLKDGGKCTRIVKVDPDDFSKKCVLWNKDDKEDTDMAKCDLENGPIPKKGDSSSKSYSKGWCGVHVTQYQKTEDNKNPTVNYELDVIIQDSNRQPIGSTLGVSAPAGKDISVYSKLPLVLLVTAQSTDDQAVLFRYGGQSWGSNDEHHKCNFGAYDKGQREGDCGFTC